MLLLMLLIMLTMVMLVLVLTMMVMVMVMMLTMMTVHEPLRRTNILRGGGPDARCANPPNPDYLAQTPRLSLA